MKYLRVVVLVMVLFLSACASSVERSASIADFTRACENYRSNYLIKAGDTLEITFFGDEADTSEEARANPTNLSGTYIVRPDGKISMQLLNADVVVNGYTTDVLAKNLTIWYKKFIIEPIITVNIREFAPRVIYVGGEVEEPQQIGHTHDLSVLDAIVSAGYFTDDASESHVTVIRSQGIGIRPMAITLDMINVIDNSAPFMNLALLPDDLIIVSKSGIAKVNKWIDYYIRRNLPVPVAVPLGGS